MNHYEQYIGQILDGRYRINALLGVGGMAAVLVAKDLKTNRNVAIKMLKEDYANDKQAVLRFINEGKAVAMLDHENIVKIYDVVVTDKEKYLVMKYIEGETLRSYMDRMGPLPFEKAVDILAQILTALDHAHRKGIVHRDIKPQNVMILKSGKVILTDFGIAQIAGGNTVIDDKAIGTVYYISPEQASGEPIDARSDLYSLGAMAFEMLTGKLPFYADSAVSVALMQINSQAPSPREYLPTIPVGMEQIILFAMAKSPKERFQSAGQMLLYLNTLKADPFAEFAVSPKEQYRNALEEERKAGEARKKAEAEAKETEKPKQNIRIIDYKSSIKDIDLNEVKAGIKLQLLTYMNEMCKQESAEPAGAFYYNLIEPMVKASQNMSDEQIEEELRKQFKMRGLILADVDIIRKMDKNLDTGSSNIIPATINKDETLSKKASNISKQQFEYLQKYTNKIIKQISEEILSGNINIKPYYNTKNKKTPCEYCTYKSICQFENGICKKEYNYISNLEKEAILEMMKEK